MCVDAWVTNFCRVAPDILSIITAVFLAPKRKSISSSASSRKVTQELWVFVELALYHTFWHLEFGGGF
jgi:hypothetical protein